MKGPRQHFPANRLAAALAEARSMSVALCIKRATQNLDAIAPECRAEVLNSLDRLESALKEWPDSRNQEYLASLYTKASRVIGLASTAGLPALDEAATGLCDVLEALLMGHGWRRAPVEVYVRSMRMLSLPDVLPDGGVELAEGLAKLGLHYRRWTQSSPPELGRPVVR